MSLPSFSIITVVFNCQETVESTIKSVLSQDYKQFEYIIIDGGSTDGTLDIINQYSTQIDIIVSEPDEGIYDAMNKGIYLAKGSWINFLNAGDEYYSISVLKKISEIQNNRLNLIYGNALNYHVGTVGQNYTYRKVLNDKLYRRYPPCHQACFFRRELFKDIGMYSLLYKLSSDFDWLISYIKKYSGTEAHHVDDFFVKYLIGGISMKQIGENEKERLMICKSQYSRNVLVIIECHIRYLIRIPILFILKIVQNTYLLGWYRKLKYGAIKVLDK